MLGRTLILNGHTVHIYRFLVLYMHHISGSILFDNLHAWLELTIPTTQQLKFCSKTLDNNDFSFSPDRSYLAHHWYFPSPHSIFICYSPSFISTDLTTRSSRFNFTIDDFLPSHIIFSPSSSVSHNPLDTRNHYTHLDHLPRSPPMHRSGHRFAAAYCDIFRSTWSLLRKTDVSGDIPSPIASHSHGFQSQFAVESISLLAWQIL